MRYNWLRDDPTKKKINIKWEKGSGNQADYFSKDHPPTVHLRKRKDYILEGHNIVEVVAATLLANPYKRARVC